MGKDGAHCEQSLAPCSLVKGANHSLTTTQAQGGQAKP